MKEQITIIALFLLSTLFGYAQTRGPIKTTTESLDFSYLRGFCPSKQTYSYYEDEEGNYIKHGSYKANGSEKKTPELDDRRYYITAKYSATAKFKDGWLDGPIMINTAYNINTYYFYSGSTTKNHTVYTFSGAYKEGVHNGVWKMTTTENGKVIRNNIMSFKNGKYTGKYSADYSNLSRAEGQFNSKGQLTGTWTITSTSGYVTTKQYYNGVLLSSISRSKGKVEYSINAAQAHKDTALLFAKGEISKEELEAKGYEVSDRYLDLSYAFSDFYIKDVLHIDQIGGDKHISRRSKTTINNEIKYTIVEKLKVMSDEQFNLFQKKEKYPQYKNDETQLVCGTTNTGKIEEYPYYYYQTIDKGKLIGEKIAIFFVLGAKEYNIYIQRKSAEGVSNIENELAKVTFDPDGWGGQKSWTDFYFTPKQASIYNKDITKEILIYVAEIQAKKGEKIKSLMNVWDIYYNHKDIDSCTYQEIANISQTANLFLNLISIEDAEYYDSYAKKIADYGSAAAFLTIEKLKEIQPLVLKEKERLEKLTGEKMNEISTEEKKLSNYLNKGYKGLDLSKKFANWIDEDNLSDLQSYLDVLKFVNKANRSRYFMQYSSVEQSIDNKEDAISFISPGFTYYEKLFGLHMKFSKFFSGIFNEQTLFEDASKYKEEEIISAFILFYKEHNVNDVETAIKVMDRVVEMSENAKSYSRAAKSVTNKEEALAFFTQSENYFNKLFQLHDLYNKKSKDAMFEDATLYEYDGIINAFILFFKAHDKKDEATILKVMNTATKMKENGMYYNTMAKTVTNAKQAIEFFSSDLNYYNKLFTVDALYAKKPGKNAVFTDASHYKEKELINVFITFLNGHNENDKETAIKIMDNLIKMSDMKCKKIKKAAEKITTYNDALNFLQNVALGMCK